MSTIVSRSLTGKDVYDKIAVKSNIKTYEDKWGVIEVTLTSYSWGSGSTSGDYGNVTVQVPNYDENSDDIIVDDDALTTSGGTTSIAQKYYFAVNNGVVGPAARTNPDGSVDLIYLEYTQPADNSLTPTAVTLTYSIAFTDLTPTSNPSNTGTLTLKVNNNRTADEGILTQDSSTFTNKNGYVSAQMNSISTTVIDMPITVTDPVQNDLTPLFSITTTGTSQALISTAMSKVSGLLTFQKELFVFAINNGKVDGNGVNIKATTSQASFLKAKIEKLPDWPCDDHITSLVNYALAFVEIV